MLRISCSVVLVALLAFVAGGAAAQEVKVDPGEDGSPAVTHAIAVLHPTEGNQARGVVRFEAADEGLEVEGELENAPPGLHGTHVHLLGDCSAPDATSADTHFNFAGSARNPPEDIDRITGDLGNFEVGEDGKGELSGEIRRASIQGPYSILGRAVVVHEKPNDPSQPPIGGAGGRIACGVIGIAED